MRRAIGWLAAAVLLAGGTVLPAPAEQLRAPDYVMEGYDGDGAGHDWETNLFFQRMQEDTGIIFEYRQHTGEEEWEQRKRDIALESDLPDVLFKAGLTDEETLEMAEKGILLDLKPYLPEHAPDLWKLLEANPEYMHAVTLPDGTIRALPAINELPANNLMWINQSWLKSLKLETPRTVEELTETLRAFRDRDPNRNGRRDEVPLSALGIWDLRFLAHGFGIVENDYYLSVRDGQVESSLKSEENRAFLAWLHQLWEEGLLSRQTFATMDSIRQITDEKADIPYGMFLSSSPLTVVPAAALDQYEALDPLSFGGKQVYRDLLGTLTRGTFALTRSCGNPERMVEWVNRLYTAEGSILIQAGREGEEFLRTEDGGWEWMADLATVANEVLPKATLADGGAAPGIAERSFQEQYADSATKRILEGMGRVQDKAVFPFPLVFLSREDAARAAELQAAIAPYADKAMAEFVTGDRPLDDAHWEAFGQELDRRGLEEMKALWQKYI